MWGKFLGAFAVGAETEADGNKVPTNIGTFLVKISFGWLIDYAACFRVPSTGSVSAVMDVGTA